MIENMRAIALSADSAAITSAILKTHGSVVTNTIAHCTSTITTDVPSALARLRTRAHAQHNNRLPVSVCNPLAAAVSVARSVPWCPSNSGLLWASMHWAQWILKKYGSVTFSISSITHTGCWEDPVRRTVGRHVIAGLGDTDVLAVSAPPS